MPPTRAAAEPWPWKSPDPPTLLQPLYPLLVERERVVGQQGGRDLAVVEVVHLERRAGHHVVLQHLAGQRQYRGSELAGTGAVSTQTGVSAEPATMCVLQLLAGQEERGWAVP